MRHLLLYGRLPELGRVKTRLAGVLGDQAALSIYQALLKQAMDACERAGYQRRTFVYDGNGLPAIVPAGWDAVPQQGDGLGERLRVGAQRAFAEGARVVTLAGTDHPRLDGERLTALAAAAEARKFAILPATDGGYAAISMQPDALPVLEDIPWSTHEVLAATLWRAQALGLEATLLPTVRDIDEAEDWLALHDEAGACSPTIQGALSESLPAEPPAERDPTVALVIPVFNERPQLESLLAHLKSSGADEVLLVDGGSTDGSREWLLDRGINVIQSPKGRAIQMNAGAVRCRSDVLLFLHADTRLPADWRRAVTDSMRRGPAGRFSVRIDAPGLRYRMLGCMINLHSRLKGVATGDQAIFMSRRFFWRLGGFPIQPLMEDIELSRRIKRIGERLHSVAQQVQTSARRWQTGGYLRTIWLMWRIRWRYWRGASSGDLALEYNRAA